MLPDERCVDCHAPANRTVDVDGEPRHLCTGCADLHGDAERARMTELGFDDPTRDD